MSRPNLTESRSAGAIRAGTVERLPVRGVRVRPVARHEGDVTYCLTSEEDISGDYIQVNRGTVFCPARSLYIEVSREMLRRIRAGQEIRVASSACS